MVVTQKDLPESPIVKASFVSKLFFWWLNGIFGLGNKRNLEMTDLYQALPNDKSNKLGDRMAELWQEEMDKVAAKGYDDDKDKKSAQNDKSYRPSLRKVIVKQFGVYYMMVGMLALIEECFTRIAQPICLGFLIRYFSGEFEERDGYLFAGGVVLGSVLYTFTHHTYFFGVQDAGMKIRIACCSLIYRKSLRLSQIALGKTTIGQMVNLLSNDVGRFDQCVIFLHYLWVGPIQTAIVTVILWTFYGPSCLVGLFVLVLFVPFQGYMGSLFSKLRTQTAGKTDRRIRVMNEIVNGMRVIKMYVWEAPFSLLVGESREDEVAMLKKTSRLRAVNMSLFYTSSKIIIFLTLLTYVLTGHHLTAEKVFVTLSLYNNVRLIMTLFFPNGVSQLAEALVSIKRIETFLLMEDRQLAVEGGKPGQEPCVYLDKVTAQWTPDSHTLTDVSIDVKQKELIAVIGHVGSGKSSLLDAILLELPAASGTIEVRGTVAYACQEPWVFAGTVKENIIFGKPFRQEWYDKVVYACALTRDLELLPYGDATLVGDRGSSLSGGQKARITLARAVFADADIYLLDDPLSAVDASVGRHLFEKCICELLSNKTRILITHQLQFLKTVNHIILLNDGKIESEGTFDDLIKSGIDFAQLLQTEEEEDSTESPAIENKKINRIRTRTFSNASTTSSHGVGVPRSRSLSIAQADGSLSGNAFVFEEFEELEEEVESGGETSGFILEQTRKPSAPKAMEEQGSSGNVKLSLYVKYFKVGSNCFTMTLLLFSNLITQVLFTGSDYWLNFWTKVEEDNSQGITPPVDSSSYLYKIYTDRDTQIIIYASIIVGLFIASLLRTIVFFDICMKASINLHKWMFEGVLHAPMRFFETNPVGRILNRLAKDVGIVDELLPATMFDVFDIFLNVIGIMVIIGIVSPILLAPAAVLSVVFYLLRRFYLRTARSIKRLEGITRSPVFSHLSTSLYGLSTIRAFRAEQEFIKQFDDFQDMHTSAWFLFIASTRWLGIWLDWISVTFITFVTFSFMFASQSGAQVGLAVSSAMMLTGMFQWGVRQSAEVENQMVSVERVMEYTKLEPEAALESAEGKKPPPDWPKKGEIRMENVQLRYGSADPVLNNITCVFRPSEKVGIVGRTGAGKSSLITALFRIAEPTGVIIIDGINVLNIGLHDLRSKISIIPQDPVLFSGTLRKNLDPFQNYSDSEIWAVLDDIHLSHDVKQIAAALDVEISEGGSNFSVGQRQLVCLGRAILRKNKILVLDEATANVDPETDNLIQKTIRTKFLNCTVLTVAHRLHTVMDSDRILVLDAGTVKEFNEPSVLLNNKSSALYSLVQQTGPATSENLIKIANEAAVGRNAKRIAPLAVEDE